MIYIPKIIVKMEHANLNDRVIAFYSYLQVINKKVINLIG